MPGTRSATRTGRRWSTLTMHHAHTSHASGAPGQATPTANEVPVKQEARSVCQTHDTCDWATGMTQPTHPACQGPRDPRSMRSA
eukprot:14979390-Alexandrium_andersonii.AAC.1